MGAMQDLLGEPPLCPECHEPIWEADAVRGRWRRVHSRCVTRRRERLRRVRAARRRRERWEDVDRMVRAQKNAWMGLGRAVEDRNLVVQRAERAHLAWVRSDIRLMALLLNLRSPLIWLACGQTPDRDPQAEAREDRTDTGVVMRVIDELGTDAVSRIADMVGWEGVRPWLSCRPPLRRTPAIPCDYREQIETPRRIADGMPDGTYRADLDDEPLVVSVDQILDRMWREDATDPTRSPSRLRPWRPDHA